MADKNILKLYDKSKNVMTPGIADIPEGMKKRIYGVGELESLNTDYKGDLVGAINEVKDGTAGIDDNVVSSNKVWSSAKTQEQINNILNLPSTIYFSETPPQNPQEGDLWFKIIIPEDIVPIDDYLFRFDASKLALDDGAKVAEWKDLSVHGNDLIQTTETNQPTFLKAGLNNKPTVLFDNSWLDKFPFTLNVTDANTVFAVCQVDNLTNSAVQMAIGRQSSQGGMSFAVRFSSSIKVIAGYFNNSKQGGSTSTIDNSPLVFAYKWDKSMSKGFKNGVSNTQVAYTQDIGAHDTLRLGRNAGTAPYNFHGRISEIIYFDRCLADEEVATMNSYLMAKWGL